MALGGAGDPCELYDYPMNTCLRRPHGHGSLWRVRGWHWEVLVSMGGAWRCIFRDHGIPWDCKVAYRHMGGIWEELESHAMTWEAEWDRMRS